MEQPCERGLGMGRKVIIEENGKRIFEGPERREQVPIERIFFGLFTVRDVVAGFIYVISVVVTITIFWVKSEARDTKMDATLAQVVEFNGYVKEYMESADNFHTLVTGELFKGGKPLNPSYTSRYRVFPKNDTHSKEMNP